MLIKNEQEILDTIIKEWPMKITFVEGGWSESLLADSGQKASKE